MMWNLALGHPHMFIDVSIKFMLNEKSLDGFYVYWKIDEMNSAWIIEEFDKNKSNRFEISEQTKIYNGDI